MYRQHGGRILWRRCINFLLSYSYTSTWYLWGFAHSQDEPRQLDTSEFIGCHFDGPSIACKRGLRIASWAEAAWYEFIGWRFDGPPIAARLYLTNSAKRKRRKPLRSATDGALGRLESNSTSMSGSGQDIPMIGFLPTGLDVLGQERLATG